MATLIESLAFSGSRLSDGTPNAGGKVWFYVPGAANTKAPVYADADASVALTQPVTLDSAGRAIVYSASPARMEVYTSKGARVDSQTELDASNLKRAEEVEIVNDFFPSQADLDSVLTKAGESVGGTDFKYKESAGATARTIQSVLSENHVSVEDFDAKGDNVHDDTTEIQKAINRVAALGGGVVYFPPGTYKTTSALTIPSDSIELRGAGAESAILNCTTAAANGITSNLAVRIRDLTLAGAAASTGTAILMTGVTGPVVQEVIITGFLVGIAFAGESSATVVNNCTVTTKVDASAIGISYNTAGVNAVDHRIIGGMIVATGGSSVKYDGTVSGGVILGATLGGSNKINFAATLTGSGFRIFAARASGAPLLTVGTATLPGVVQIGTNDGVYNGTGNSVSAATGTAVTPDMLRGRVLKIEATGGAGVVTVNAPAHLPVGTDASLDTWLVLHLWNHAGGAVTWTMNAIYHLGPAGAPAAIATTDTYRTIIGFLWDPDASVFREAYRTACT